MYPLQVTYFIIFLKYKQTLVNLLHIVIIILLPVVIINNVFVLSLWSIKPLTTFTDYDYNLYSNFELVGLNNGFLEVYNPVILKNYVVNSFNFMLHDTTPEIYSFFFNLTNSLQNQTLMFSSLLFYYFVHTNDFLPQAILNGILVILFILLLSPKRKTLIIF